jgi:hypothetical protein
MKFNWIGYVPGCRRPMTEVQKLDGSIQIKSIRTTPARRSASPLFARVYGT